MKNQDRLTIRIDADMRAKLHERAGALGLDDAGFARMVLYGEINGHGLATPRFDRTDGYAMGIDGRGGGGVDLVRDRPASVFGVADGSELPVDEPRAEDFEVPADADGGIPLDDLLGAGPSILDEMMAAAPAPQPVARPAAPTYRSALPQRAARQQSRPQVWGAFGGVYSMTRPVGVNESATGANTTGDGRGNVLRDNMRHFGIAGTRAR